MDVFSDEWLFLQQDLDLQGLVDRGLVPNVVSYPRAAEIDLDVLCTKDNEPIKVEKTEDGCFASTALTSQRERFISFDGSLPDQDEAEMMYYNNEETLFDQNNAKKKRRGLSYAQDHVLAEKKRREKLKQRFLSLTAFVPGLRKMDKASVLDEAIKYMKQLEQENQTLKEKLKSFQTNGTSSDEISSASYDNNFDNYMDPAPSPEFPAMHTYGVPTRQFLRDGEAPPHSINITQQCHATRQLYMQ